MKYQQYRFDFTSLFATRLAQFAAEHVNKDRKTFQKEWSNWCEIPEIHEQIAQESLLMEKNGFQGDVLDKMYKSARYYHRKNKPKIKEFIHKEHTNRFTREFLECMDDQIEEYIRKQSNGVLDSNARIPLSQSMGYEQFCKTHQDEIYAELLKIKENRGRLDAATIGEKLKKAYKTRFYTKRKNHAYNFAE